ncbi:MAG: gas vesicle protein GvpJ [Dehalococcoidia bacterium]
MNERLDLLGGQHIGLVDAIDHLLDKGVVVAGDAMVSLAGVDLMYLKLSLMLASVERLGREGMTGGASPAQAGPTAPPEAGPSNNAGPDGPPKQGAFHGQGAAKDSMLPAIGPAALPEDGAPDEAQGLAKLVLTLVDLLRRVLEHQALRRVEGGSLTEDDTERMGLALMQLEAKMADLCSAFGLTPNDLEIDLGPLGKID